MDEFIRLNIAIIPTREVSELAIRLSRDLSKELETRFTLDGIDFYPHATCYTVEYPKNNFERVKEYVENVSQSFNKFEVNLKGLKITKEGNVYGVEIGIEKSEDIDKLHRQIIKRLNPLREGHLREKYKNPNYIAKFPKDRRELMKKIMFKVGYARVLDVYNPHISITLFEPSVKKSDIMLPKLEIETIKVEIVGIFTMGEWGTCNKLINKFRLR